MPAYDPHAIEAKWQEYWERNRTFCAEDAGSKPKLYVLDMFPYPSGEGLHVGHPEGYSATDIYCRFKRMKGYNVLHPMGYDAFGLPAEQYAIGTGTHPRVTTEKNISNIRRQIKRLGFSYDWDRELATTDPEYVRWTQWIFLLLFETWYDPEYEWMDPGGKKRTGKGRPIRELPIPAAVYAGGEEAVCRYRDSFRLAYQAESPVNWCAALGTVLADEEVINGRSERGDHPVERIPLRQWMLRITAYADRLIEDLESLQWPEPIKEMQKNWVGRSRGAEVDFYIGIPGAGYVKWAAERKKAGFPGEPGPDAIRIYTTRPDTLFGATYMVLAPEHPLVDVLTAGNRRNEVEEYRKYASTVSEEDRIAGRGEKTGVFTGGHAVNPANGEKIPVWIADYVLISYGTGAIMAVPGHDQRDLEFARTFRLPVRAVVMPTDEWFRRMQSYLDRLHDILTVEVPDKEWPPRDPIGPGNYKDYVDLLPEAFTEDGEGTQSANSAVSLNGLPTPQAKEKIAGWLAEAGIGRPAVKYKLRDWLFSRQRYWGEPIPILHALNADGEPDGTIQAVGEDELPVLLPEMDDFKPTGRPGGPLEKATEWIRVRKSGREFARETNTMPQWAGSCWYYLRFCDPRNRDRAWDSEKEKYWMPVDLYVGGAEHAVLHLLYSRFWHKVLYDRGHVSTLEPFQKLVNQGMILSTTYRNSRDRIVPYSKIDFRDGGAFHQETGEELAGVIEKMSKSRGNVIPVDAPVGQYGADTTRLYEMFIGPLESTKPWSMQGVEGIHRFLNRSWRMIVDESSDRLRLNPAVFESDAPAAEEHLRVLHRTIDSVSGDLENLSFNTAISRLMEFVNYFTAQEARPLSCMEPFVLMLSPLAPHISEELWRVLGHEEAIAYAPWPDPDPRYIQESALQIPVQINGRVRGRITVPADADEKTLERAALQDPKVKKHLEGHSIRKTIVIPKKMINIVAAPEKN
ncbi:MAG: leucine--tRNA ligase [Acidobacteria bacterium]|nr:leucine--tRNA ligase [Acidobacteriota bacterium]